MWTEAHILEPRLCLHNIYSVATETKPTLQQYFPTDYLLYSPTWCAIRCFWFRNQWCSSISYHRDLWKHTMHQNLYRHRLLKSRFKGKPYPLLSWIWLKITPVFRTYHPKMFLVILTYIFIMTIWVFWQSDINASHQNYFSFEISLLLSLASE